MLRYRERMPLIATVDTVKLLLVMSLHCAHKMGCYFLTVVYIFDVYCLHAGG